jgi:SMODS-associated and fused to various effectors sensor domain
MVDFLAILGITSSLVSIGTFVFSILTYIRVKSNTKKLRSALAQLPALESLPQIIEHSKAINSSSPIALAFSLTPGKGSLRKQVQDFLQGSGMKMPVDEVQQDGLSPENIQEFYELVRAKKREIDAKELTEVHIFFSGPIPAAMIVGCLFTNWLPVKMYHYQQQTGSYVYWMPLIKS